MRNRIRFIGLAAIVSASVSCGDVVRQGSSPVFLVIDQLTASAGGKAGSGTGTGFLLSDVIINVTSPDPCKPTAPCPTVFNDNGAAVLRAPLKDVGATTPLTPTTNNEVTINRVHVEYIRADGRNTPGVDVPFAFDTAATGTIPAGSTVTLPFELVRHAAKEESPLIQLRTASNIIATIAQVTFYGVDRVGNNVSVMGQIAIEFGNFGDQ